MESNWRNRKTRSRGPITNNPRRKWKWFGGDVSEREENGGDRSSNQTRQEANGGNLRNVESGGDEIIIIAEMDGLVGAERMELREEQVQMVRK